MPSLISLGVWFLLILRPCSASGFVPRALLTLLSERTAARGRTKCISCFDCTASRVVPGPVSYTHLRAHETGAYL
eukprot:4120715-Pyramimonas_sp.AAC.1